MEIAVASFATTSAKDWKDNTEIHFRKKVWFFPFLISYNNKIWSTLACSVSQFQIEMLSKINHKNFANLLGYCEEKEPFTRILIFEYAPNGSLFEHLHCEYFCHKLATQCHMLACFLCDLKGIKTYFFYYS